MGAGGSRGGRGRSRGLEVAILDRKDLPRDKPCGNGLLPHAAAEMRRMGLDAWLAEPGHGRFEGYAIYSKTATIVHHRGEPGYMIPRKETDAALP